MQHTQSESNNSFLPVCVAGNGISPRCNEMAEKMREIAAVAGSADADALFLAGFSDKEIAELAPQAAKIATQRGAL